MGKKDTKPKKEAKAKKENPLFPSKPKNFRIGGTIRVCKYIVPFSIYSPTTQPRHAPTKRMPIATRE